MARKRVIIIGAGGFAREVRWLLDEIDGAGSEQYAFAGFVVSDPASLGERDSRKDVRGDLDWLMENRGAFDALAIGIGSPGARASIAAQLGASFDDGYWPALVHPSVHADRRSCVFEPGSLVCAGTIATVNVTVHRHALINLSCTLGHEASIGAASVLNPTVNISGGVCVGEQVLVGTGSQVLQYVEIGDRATVGAGAVVTKHVAADTTVVGIPAKARAPRIAAVQQTGS